MQNKKEKSWYAIIPGDAAHDDMASLCQLLCVSVEICISVSQAGRNLDGIIRASLLSVSLCACFFFLFFFPPCVGDAAARLLISFRSASRFFTSAAAAAAATPEI